MSRLIAVYLTVLGFLLFPAASHGEQEWGTIQGQVVWAPDKLPEPVKVKPPEGIQFPACVKGGEVLVDQYVVDPKTRGVRWVVVWLLDASGDPCGS
jgi:hypothetical protein